MVRSLKRCDLLCCPIAIMIQECVTVTFRAFFLTKYIYQYTYDILVELYISCKALEVIFQ